MGKKDPLPNKLKPAVLIIMTFVFVQGGVGFKPRKGIFGVDKLTGYMVAQLDYKGTPEQWQDYCRRIVQLWGPDLGSIYLQRLELEFEVEVDQVNVQTKVVWL